MAKHKLLKTLCLLLGNLKVGGTLHANPPQEPFEAGTTVAGFTIMPEFPSLLDITFSEIYSGLQNASFLSQDLVSAYMGRIEDVNHELNTVIEVNPDALAIASQLDVERSEGRVRGPLHGIPILIKDNIVTADKMQTTAGSFCLEGSKPPREATIVQFLRKAGAIILGKTNMSEWANYRSTNSSDGWSARGGQTYGAYHRRQYACGSSSGSAVAASVGLAFAAIGTETDGSITCPSAYNNIVGIKPTLGLVPRDLVISGAQTQDSVGPLARSVKDAAIVLTAISGKSEYDDATKKIPFDTIPDFSEACHGDSLKGARIGVPRNLLYGDDTVLAAFETAIQHIKDSGAVVVDVTFPKLDEFNHVDMDKVIGRELADGIATYLDGLKENPQQLLSVNDVITCLKADGREEYPHFDVEILEKAILAPSRGSAEYETILSCGRRLAIEDGILAMLDKMNLDAVVLPESSKIATSIAAVGGFPVITVPMGFYPEKTPVEHHRFGPIMVGPHIPFGLQLIGRHFDDKRLIGYAFAYEQRSRNRGRQVPRIRPSTELQDVIPNL